MTGTVAVELLRQWAARSLFAAAEVYRSRASGELQYDGVRPDQGWHAHGYFRVVLWMVVDGAPRRLGVWKRRWLEVATGRTVHSRPPDNLPRVSSCTLIVVLTLWSWLDGDAGVEGYRHALPGLEQHGSRRSVQRWLRRALPQSLKIQQAIRRAVIERCEPRPVEHLFPSGLSPPEGLVQRRWRTPSEVYPLWRGLALLMLAATTLDLPIPVLLAEARGRCP